MESSVQVSAAKVEKVETRNSKKISAAHMRAYAGNPLDMLRSSLETAWIEMLTHDEGVASDEITITISARRKS